MLKEISIRNFAIIDDLQIRFAPGLTVLSGETGAGKSIIINAVNLILGSRAAAEMIRTGAESAEVEAVFDLAPGSPACRRAAEMGYESREGLLVRRVISRSEGNRVYVNGRLATLQVLAAATENLVSISGQHAHQGLLREDQHLLILDQTAGLMPERTAVAGLFREILPLIRRLKELNARQARQGEIVALLEFQQREIAAAAVQPGEDQMLEQERLRLKNAEALRRSVLEGIDALYGDSGAVVERLVAVRRSLEKMERIDPQLAGLRETCAEIGFRAEDLAAGMQSYLKGVESAEGRLEAVEERLDTLTRLKRKYGGSLDTVLEKLHDASAELAQIETLAADIGEAEAHLSGLQERLAREARALSRKRSTAAKRFAARVAEELSQLKMPGTAFTVELSELPADAGSEPYLTVGSACACESGIDRAVFTISPNVGEALKPLAAIASGGELSRVVLALKSILAATDALSTIIFDEVDAGIGGAAAEVVGRKMAQLAEHHQVICITHLPQIARFGDQHFKIAKAVKAGRTRTLITPLAADERTQEIARMLGGEQITRVTLEHARELLGKKTKKR
jgi:DNA repair protein RecN (Recombination protein N)